MGLQSYRLPGDRDPRAETGLEVSSDDLLVLSRRQYFRLDEGVCPQDVKPSNEAEVYAEAAREEFGG